MIWTKYTGLVNIITSSASACVIINVIFEPTGLKSILKKSPKRSPTQDLFITITKPNRGYKIN